MHLPRVNRHSSLQVSKQNQNQKSRFEKEQQHIVELINFQSIIAQKNTGELLPSNKTSTQHTDLLHTNKRPSWEQIWTKSVEINLKMRRKKSQESSSVKKRTRNRCIAAASTHYVPNFTSNAISLLTKLFQKFQISSSKFIMDVFILEMNSQSI